MKSIRTIINKCLSLFQHAIFKSRFASFGEHSVIIKPLRINGYENIYIGKKVGIHNQGWLAARGLTGCHPILQIGDGTTIGDFSHIFATRKICIGKNVLIANFVYISDNVHGYEDVDKPIIRQPIIQKNDVFIGDDSWIGEHVSIIGASIGKHCVIGANSVVTRDIPDYCVAVGSPARVIKQYDLVSMTWEKV